VRNINEILEEKELAIERLRREIEALQSVTPLFAEPRAIADTSPASLQPTNESAQQLHEALRTVAPLLLDDAEELDPDLRARLADASEADCRQMANSRLTRHLKQITAPLLGRHGERQRGQSIFPGISQLRGSQL
jgi:hypothetical protein